ncbi:MAG TPA: 2'-5' RNA ligase family protein [Streptosporangiaceae bacterium]
MSTPAHPGTPQGNEGEASVPQRMADHWWWRPGWQPGRRMFTFHITFDGQPAVHQLAHACQDALRGLGGLDFVPPQWLHLTMQGVGFTDEVSTADADAIVHAAQDRLTQLSSLSLTLGPVTITPEAILLPAEPHQGLTGVRDALRAAILDVWPPSRLMEKDTWTAHATIAYSNSDGPVAPYQAALNGVPGTAQAQVTSVQLIILGRDEHSYEWSVHATIPLNHQQPRPS